MSEKLASAEIDESRKRKCRHKTVGCCKICKNCFACCDCRSTLKEFMRIAERVKKRDHWFIGGFLGALAEELEDYCG